MVKIEDSIVEEIIKEKISADHLLYVSLKYTKTCDVIVNLLIRWARLIETSTNKILIHAKKKKKIPSVSENPVGRIDQIKKLFKKDKKFLEVIDLYHMFKKINELKKERTGEFRKNVTLKVFYQGKEININLEQLKDYSEKLENFVNTTKKYIQS